MMINVDLWMYILFVILVLFVIVYAMMTGKAVEWLKYACAITEKELGSGTGQLKLRQVYDMFIDKYPAFSTIVPFFVFKDLVDLALKWLRNQIENNSNVKGYMDGK